MILKYYIAYDMYRYFMWIVLILFIFCRARKLPYKESILFVIIISKKIHEINFLKKKGIRIPRNALSIGVVKRKEVKEIKHNPVILLLRNT